MFILTVFMHPYGEATAGPAIESGYMFWFADVLGCYNKIVELNTGPNMSFLSCEAYSFARYEIFNAGDGNKLRSEDSFSSLEDFKTAMDLKHIGIKW